MKELPYARQQKIIEQLNQLDRDECLRTEQLARDFNVSSMTIYRDIMQLEKRGAAKRVYGGIQAARQKAGEDETQELAQKLPGQLQPYADSTIEERFLRQKSEKQAIAKAAMRYIRDGDVIAIDPSTTTLHLCSFLVDRRLTVVTTSMSVVLQFASSRTVDIILCGGMIRKSALSTVGSLLSGTLDQLSINRCFVSSHAFSYKQGLTDMTLEECEAKRRLISASDEINVLVDHTKINRYAPFVVCRPKQISRIITDFQAKEDPAYEKTLRACRDDGCEIIYADARE